MILNWFSYSVASVILLGLSLAFYKMPSFKGYSPFLSTFYANGLAAVLAGVFLYFLADISAFHISFLGIIWGILFAVTMIFQKITLKTVESNALFPITTSISNIVTILIGLVALSENISLVQIFGVLIIILSVYLFTRKKEDFILGPKILLLSIGVVIASTLSKYVQKLGAVNEPLFNFMVWQYIGASVTALVGAFILERNTCRELISSKKYLLGSFIIGIFSFFGGWAILKALSLAPLSVVYAIHPTYVLITAIVGTLVFKENLTRRKLLLISLMVFGIILIKIG